MFNPGSWSAPAPPATPTRRSAAADPETTWADTQRRTALPTSLFGGGPSELEARLTEGAGDLLLRHLACEGGADDLTDVPEEESGPAGRAVDDDAVTALLAQLAGSTDPSPLSLDAGLAAERAHVLADLASTCDGHARQAASRRLSDLIGDPQALGEIGVDHLGELVANLAGLPGDGAGACILLQVLRMAATRVLDTAEEIALPLSPQSALRAVAP